MEISARELFVRWLSGLKPDSASHRALFTASLLLEQDAEISGHLSLENNLNLIDSSLVDSMLAIASPIEVACVLWSPVGQALDPAIFSRWVEFVWSRGQDFRALHYLGGAVHDYMRHHQGVLQPPAELAYNLLAAPFIDARIIGAKLAGATLTDFGQLWNCLAPMVTEQSNDECLAALYVLVEALHSHLHGTRTYSGLQVLDEIRSACGRIESSRARPEQLEMRELLLRKILDIQQQGIA